MSLQSHLLFKDRSSRNRKWLMRCCCFALLGHRVYLRKLVIAHKYLPDNRQTFSWTRGKPRDERASSGLVQFMGTNSNCLRKYCRYCYFIGIKASTIKIAAQSYCWFLPSITGSLFRWPDRWGTQLTISCGRDCRAHTGVLCTVEKILIKSSWSEAELWANNNSLLPLSWAD